MVTGRCVTEREREANLIWIGYLKIPQLLVGKLEPVSLPEQKLEPRRVHPARQSMEEFPHLTHREE